MVEEKQAEEMTREESDCWDAMWNLTRAGGWVSTEAYKVQIQLSLLEEKITAQAEEIERLEAERAAVPVVEEGED